MARKGESIYKRNDGRWEARFVKSVSETGEKHLGSVYAKSYMEVKNKRAEIIQKIAYNKINFSQKSLTLSELMCMWLDNNNKQITVSSYLKYESIIRNHIQPNIGSYKLTQLTSSILKQFADELLRSGNKKKSKGLSVRSVNSILTIINSALKWSSEQVNTPSVKMPFFRNFQVAPPILSKLEQNLLETYAEANKNVYTNGMLISLYTGMRLGEICALQWEDVSEETIFVHNSMQRIKQKSGRWEIVVSEPKTQNSCRIIPIANRIRPILNENRKNSGYVLQQENGKFVEPRLLQKKISNIFANAGVATRNFHIFRHTFATRLIDCGSDPKTVSELLGHSSVHITLNKYVHPSLDMKKNAIDRVCVQLDSFICGQNYGPGL